MTLSCSVVVVTVPPDLSSTSFQHGGKACLAHDPHRPLLIGLQFPAIGHVSQVCARAVSQGLSIAIHKSKLEQTLMNASLFYPVQLWTKKKTEQKGTEL